MRARCGQACHRPWLTGLTTLSHNVWSSLRTCYILVLSASESAQANQRLGTRLSSTIPSAKPSRIFYPTSRVSAARPAKGSAAVLQLDALSARSRCPPPTAIPSLAAVPVLTWRLSASAGSPPRHDQTAPKPTSSPVTRCDLCPPFPTPRMSTSKDQQRWHLPKSRKSGLQRVSSVVLTGLLTSALLP